MDSMGSEEVKNHPPSGSQVQKEICKNGMFA